MKDSHHYRMIIAAEWEGSTISSKLSDKFTVPHTKQAEIEAIVGPNGR
jgi:mannitol/fructose-specific phosphotransferase system IIA component (Ntr-type)